jgi:hypothetical protein
LNSTHIRRKFEQSEKLREILQAKKKPKEIAEEVYLTILSRYPTDEEMKALKAYADEKREGRRPMMDAVWAIINGSEFSLRH